VRQFLLQKEGFQSLSSILVFRDPQQRGGCVELLRHIAGQGQARIPQASAVDEQAQVGLFKDVP